MALLQKLNKRWWLKREYNNFKPMLSSLRVSIVTLRLFSSKPLYDYSLLHEKVDRNICLIREKFGFKTPPKFVIQNASIFLYESCTDQIDILRFFEALELEDTFNSWFYVTRWHVWLVACRCMSDKLNGKKLRNELIKRMWEDVDNRLDKFCYIKRREKRKLIENYYIQFNATLLGLDEGILDNDMVLAGAIWRNLLGIKQQTVNPIILDMLVRYTRVQSYHLATTVSSNQLLFNGKFQWKHFPPLIIDNK